MLVTKRAPDFSAEAVMPGNQISEVKLSSYEGQYVLLFFYPLDFTFVCPTEILAFNEKLDHFKNRNCQVIGVSVDSAHSHLAWKNMPQAAGGIGLVQFPLIADIDKAIARSYDVLHDDAIALRGLFLIDKEQIVRHALVNDLPLGRSVDEALRVLDALQYVEEHGEVCPANWHPGDRAMQPTSEGVADYLASRIDT